MKVDIYTSAQNSGKHLVVPAGTDVGATTFPASLDPDLHTVAGPKTKDIKPGDGTIGLNPADVIARINRDGYAEVGTEVTIKVIP